MYVEYDPVDDKTYVGSRLDDGEFHTTKGIVLKTHARGECVGEYCPIHKPSDLAKGIGVLYWREDRGLMERICKHGVGHPDPDGLDAIKIMRDDTAAMVESLHGCCEDWCCRRS